MVIKVKGKEHVVRFGIKFVNELDKVFAGKDAVYGGGLIYALPRMMDGDVTVLSKVLWLSTCTEKSRPTQEDVDDFVENVEDVEALLAETIDELKKANATKIKTLRMMKIFDRTVAEAEKADD